MYEPSVDDNVHLPLATTFDKVPCCVGCSHEILDRYILRVEEKFWHTYCLRCCVCDSTFDNQLSCFVRNDSIFCKKDYHMTFPPRCHHCDQVIHSTEKVMRARKFIFHVSCFVCSTCSYQLQPGDHFGVSIDGSIFCLSHTNLGVEACSVQQQLPAQADSGSSRAASLENHRSFALANIKNQCYDADFGREERERTIPSSSSGRSTYECYEDGHMRHHLGSCDQSASRPPNTCVNSTRLTFSSVITPSSIDVCPATLKFECPEFLTGKLTAAVSSAQDMMRGSKRTATSFTCDQLMLMNRYFSLNTNPDARILEELARKADLSKKIVQVWFRNKRAKIRKSIREQVKTDCDCSPTSPASSSIASDIGCFHDTASVPSTSSREAVVDPCQHNPITDTARN